MKSKKLLFAMALTMMSMVALEASAGEIYCSAKLITVSSGQLVPDFEPCVTDYTVEVPPISTEKITLTVYFEAGDENYFSISGDGEKTLQPGENVFKIEIIQKSSGYVVDTYTITVIRGADYYLTNLTVSTGALSPEFRSNNLIYKMTVSKCTENIVLTATPENADAIVTGDGKKELNLGENTFDITVSTPHGNAVYTVIVTRMSVNFEFLRSYERTTGNTKLTYRDLRINQNVTVSLIDRYELEYILMTDNFSGDLPLHFDIEDGRYTYDKIVNVEANSIYKFSIYVGIKYEGAGSSTTYFDVYGRPNAIHTCNGSIIIHTEYDNWSHPITTYIEYKRHLCNMALSNGNELISAHELNITGNAISTISASDLTFVGNGTICETSGIPYVKGTDKLKIYPNPTTGIVYTDTESDIKVYSSQGALLQSAFGSQVDLSAYSQGIYILQVNGEWVKVVKE